MANKTPKRPAANRLTSKDPAPGTRAPHFRGIGVEDRDSEISDLYRIGLDEITRDPLQPRKAIPQIITNAAPNGAAVTDLLERWRTLVAEMLGTAINPAQFIRYEPAAADIRDNAPPTPLIEDYLELLSLAASINRDGQEDAIDVYEWGDGYKLISGERRLLAHWLLNEYGFDGFDTIEAEVTSRPNPWRQVGENGNRKDVNAISTARGIALLIMEIRSREYGDEFLAFEDLVQPGQSDHAWYAQVADGNQYRVPRDRTQEILDATGLPSNGQLRKYRGLLRVHPTLWLLADANNWTEGYIRDVEAALDDKFWQTHLTLATNPLQLTQIVDTAVSKHRDQRSQKTGDTVPIGTVSGQNQPPPGGDTVTAVTVSDQNPPPTDPFGQRSPFGTDATPGNRIPGDKRERTPLPKENPAADIQIRKQTPPRTEGRHDYTIGDRVVVFDADDIGTVTAVNGRYVTVQCGPLLIEDMDDAFTYPYTPGQTPNGWQPGDKVFVTSRQERGQIMSINEPGTLATIMYTDGHLEERHHSELDMPPKKQPAPVPKINVLRNGQLTTIPDTEIRPGDEIIRDPNQELLVMPGDRVQLAGRTGTVTHSEPKYCTVHWENGETTNVPAPEWDAFHFPDDLPADDTPAPAAHLITDQAAVYALWIGEAIAQGLQDDTQYNISPDEFTYARQMLLDLTNQSMIKMYNEGITAADFRQTVETFRDQYHTILDEWTRAMDEALDRTIGLYDELDNIV